MARKTRAARCLWEAPGNRSSLCLQHLPFRAPVTALAPAAISQRSQQPAPSICCCQPATPPRQNKSVSIKFILSIKIFQVKRSSSKAADCPPAMVQKALDLGLSDQQIERIFLVNPSNVCQTRRLYSTIGQSYQYPCMLLLSYHKFCICKKSFLQTPLLYSYLVC